MTFILSISCNIYKYAHEISNTMILIILYLLI